ncbi:MAG: Archaeal Lon protease [ANME-2 cluster archaeon HR1]|nr:MAG: Archaeal Lon protease [ANME-2 cluster archaeon HR1]
MRFILAIILTFLFVTPACALNMEEGITVPIVAAYSTPDGESGVLLNATVIVTPGNGHVFVDTQPYTQMDLQGSARMATLVASDVTGIDPSEYDFYFIIEVTSPIIGGPSAGAALTVATIADIMNWELSQDVVMTGMINPDGSIGPVGGIPYKLDAAAQYGASLFIVPEGQTEVMISNKKTVKGGPFVMIEDEPVLIDVIERGKEQNVNVVEVANIQEAVEFFTGNRINISIPPKGVWSAEYLNTLRPLSANVLSDANLLYHKALNETTQFSDILQSQEELLRYGYEQYDDQQYYAATNTGLLILNNLKFILWYEEYQNQNAEDKNEYLNNLLEQVTREINKSRQEVDAFKDGGVVDVDSVGAAEIRVVMAEQFLEDARSADSDKQFIEILAQASMRAQTVGWWLSLANSNTIIPETTLKDRAGWYVGTASSVVIYTETIIHEMESWHGLLILLQEAEESLNRAKIEYERGYYSGAIFDSLLAAEQASTAISLLGYADVDTKINRSADSARIAIEEVRNAGIEPVLAVSAYEFADSLESPSQKIVEYNYARVVAKTTMQLTNTSNLNISSNVSEMNTTTTDTPIPLKTISPAPAQTSSANEQDPVIPGFSMLLVIIGILVVSFILRR